MQKHRSHTRPQSQFTWSDLDRHPGEPRGPAPGETDPAGPIRQIERIRQRWQRPREDLAFLGKTTLISLRLEGLEAGEGDVIGAMMNGGVRGDLRSRRAQLVRNHVAIQLQVERLLRNAVPLKPSHILSWYASLCSGRPTTGLDAAGLTRLEQVSRQVNSPPLHLQAALSDIATLHADLLHDPLVPSFEGMLARLLLQYHLGRCGLPMILFDTHTDEPRKMDQKRTWSRLIHLLHVRLVSLDGPFGVR